MSVATAPAPEPAGDLHWEKERVPSRHRSIYAAFVFLGVFFFEMLAVIAVTVSNFRPSWNNCFILFVRVCFPNVALSAICTAAPYRQEPYMTKFCARAPTQFCEKKLSVNMIGNFREMLWELGFRMTQIVSAVPGVAPRIPWNSKSCSKNGLFHSESVVFKLGWFAGFWNEIPGLQSSRHHTEPEFLEFQKVHLELQSMPFWSLRKRTLSENTRKVHLNPKCPKHTLFRLFNRLLGSVFWRTQNGIFSGLRNVFFFGIPAFWVLYCAGTIAILGNYKCFDVRRGGAPTCSVAKRRPQNKDLGGGHALWLSWAIGFDLGILCLPRAWKVLLEASKHFWKWLWWL